MSEDKITPKILLVDDKPENLLSLEMILEDGDVEIFKASNGNDALKLALKNEFAVILSDVQMPEMNGFEFVEILRMNAKNKLIPIIFVTAISKEDKYVHQGYSEGAVDYLFKPLDPDIVRPKVDLFVALYRQKMQLAKQNEILSQMNEQKNHFMGIAAHDLRNPLNVVHHYSQSLMREAGENLNDTARQRVETIHSSVKFMMDLVDELLDITKIESGTFSIHRMPVGIKDLIDNAVELNNIMARSKKMIIKQNIKTPENLTAMLDSGKMNQVLNNLITNAIKYSEPGTSVEVSAEEKDNNLVFRVADKGQGIPEKELSQLFKAFGTTSVYATAGEKSTGLGLMIVQKIVEAHGGSVSVKSEVGKGSEFSVQLPLITVDEPDSAEVAVTSGDGDALNVVLAEDDALVQMIMKSVFKPYNVTLQMVNDGDELVSYVDANPDTSLIFTDLNMPKLGGLEAISQIRGKGIELPAIGLSAMVDQKIIDSCKESGMQECIEKPLNKSILEQMLKKYCGYQLS